MDRQDFERELAKANVPDYMKGGLRRYLLHGIPPGHFLRNLLSNDLRGAFERADDQNQLHVLDYIKFLYNAAPSQAWGSPAAYRAWIEHGGWDGLDAKFAADASAREAAS